MILPIFCSPEYEFICNQFEKWPKQSQRLDNTVKNEHFNAGSSNKGRKLYFLEKKAVHNPFYFNCSSLQQMPPKYLGLYLNAKLIFRNMLITYWAYLLTLRFNVRCSHIRGMLYFIVTSTSTLGVECPTLHSPILCQWFFQAFYFQIIFYAFQSCFPETVTWVTTSCNCFVHLSWPCVWIHMLKMTILTKTLTSQCICYDTQTQLTS